MDDVIPSRRLEGPRRSAGAAPPRQPGGLRRTSSIDVFFPGGRAGNMHLLGRARDAVTPVTGGAPVILAEDFLEAQLRQDRIIAAIEAEPARPALHGLVGQSGSGGFRGRLRSCVPEERAGATPLYLLLDDIPGASLVCGWAWSQWDANWLEHARQTMTGSTWFKRVENRENICIANAAGEKRARPEGLPDRVDETRVAELRNPEDPQGWHEFPPVSQVNFRRARRIDIVRDELIRVDAAFQDSASRPDGGRAAVHEYRLCMTADPGSLTVVSVRAEPRVLPYFECSSAADALDALVGTKLAELRERVLAEFRGAAGCTHLNDALRALAEVPALLTRLEQM